MHKKVKTKIDLSSIPSNLSNQIQAYRDYIKPLGSRIQYNAEESADIIQMLVFLADQLEGIESSSMQINLERENNQVFDVKFNPDSQFMKICEALGLKIHPVYNYYQDNVDQNNGRLLHNFLKLTLVNNDQLEILKSTVSRLGASVDSPYWRES